MRLPVNITDYVETLDLRTRFIQANYGDGEWACILGLAGQNCNGERYTPDVQAALIKTLQFPPPGHVWYGSNPGNKLKMGVEGWLLSRGLTQRAWVYKEIISGANVNGKLRPFIEAVRRRRTVLVGPPHLRDETLQKIWGIRAHVSVPAADAYLAIQRTTERLRSVIDTEKPDLVLVCSGMAANPLIFNTAMEYHDITLIDMGATLDPYAGVFSRSGYRKDEFQKTNYQKNIEGLI